MKRCILVFPNFENMAVIDRIRDQYDPLCKYVRPHITLVFPFESDLSSEELRAHISTALAGCKPFNMTMRGFTVSVEPMSNYLFLNVIDGLEWLYDLSRKLYTGPLAAHQSDQYRESYCPHLTVGNLTKDVGYDAIMDVLAQEKTEFASSVDCVSVMILGDKIAELEMTVPLTQGDCQ